MRRPQYKLQFWHKCAITFCLIVSVMFLANPRAYYMESSDNVDAFRFPFLQEGDYVVEYTLAKPAPETMKIEAVAPGMVGSDNQVGVILAKEEIPQNATGGSLRLRMEQSCKEVTIQIPQIPGSGICFESFRFQSVQLLCTDHYLLSFLWLLAAALIAFLGAYVPLEKYRPILIAAGFGLLACIPMATDFLMMSDPDTGFHLARLESVYQGLRAGEFPVRIGSVQMGGYGSLSATMYPQGFLYPVAVLRFFRVSLMLCYKLLIAGCNVGAAILAYLAAKAICRSEKTGIWVSFLYAFSLYRLIDIYQRGALGESLALTFLPLVVWGIYEILWGDEKKWYLLALGVSAVLESHLLSFEMCVLFLVAVVLCRWLEKDRRGLGRRMLAGIKAAGFTILLNASFLVPFLYFCGEDLQCFFMPNELSDSLLYFSQMFFSFAHASGSNQGPGTLREEMPLTVGGILLLGSILFIAMASGESDQSRERRVGKWFLGYGFAALLLTSWIFPWDRLSRFAPIDALARTLQFPWRFLGLASFFLCVVTALGMGMLERKPYGGRWIYGCAIVIVFLSASYFFEMAARETDQAGDKMEVNGYSTTDSLYMYYDGVSFKPHNLKDTYRVACMRSIPEQIYFSGLKRSGSSLEVDVAAREEPGGSILFPIYYYPGYQVYVNGERTENYSCQGLLACDAPADDVHIAVRYGGLPIFRAGDIVSLVTVVLGCFFAGRKRLRNGRA